MTQRLMQAAQGEKLERPPVWIMRQAGRYMKVYRNLRQKYPSFRERSENPDLAVEISLQPFHAFEPDGVIMFSDILTPLSGIGINFDVVKNKGPVFRRPIRSRAQVEALTPLEPENSLPFIEKILKTLRHELRERATVLGFAGAPWTLAAYAVEGKGSKNYTEIKGMAFREPGLLHMFLNKLANATATYLKYQISCGAQVVQLFDSWAGRLNPVDYEKFALPYQQQVIRQVKEIYPDTPIILCVHDNAGVIDYMSASGADIIQLDWTLDVGAARKRLGNIPVQGNLDPCVLLGSKDFIRERTLDVIKKAGEQGHIMNLGQGILPTTPEENVAFFFETVKQSHNLLNNSEGLQLAH